MRNVFFSGFCARCSVVDGGGRVVVVVLLLLTCLWAGVRDVGARVGTGFEGVSADIVDPRNDGRILQLVRGDERYDIDAGKGSFWSGLIDRPDGRAVYVIRNTGSLQSGWDPSELVEVMLPPSSKSLAVAVPTNVLTKQMIAKDRRFGDNAWISEFDAVSPNGDRFLLRISFADLREEDLGIRYSGYPVIFDREKNMLSPVRP